MTVHELFPDALRTDQFAARTLLAARACGFHPRETLLITGSCRDELCFSFGDVLQETWGSAFHVGSLAGMLFLGRTGLSAAAAHAPRGGRRRYLVVALTHLGLSDDGTPGRFRRPGQDHESSACGALVALRDEIASGAPIPDDLDPDDLEQDLLRWRLAHLRERGSDLDILEVTLAARDAIREDILRIGGMLDVAGAADVLVTTGVLVHAGDGDHVCGRRTERIHPDGRVEPLEG